MINRKIETKLNKYLKSDEKKILFIWGPRRSGKTTILQKISKKYHTRIFNFDFIEDRELFQPSREALEKIVSTTKIILIDEVQNYPESTQALKLLHDEYDVKIIATGM
jgi:predicted AAA+ superfamily ATPase